MNVQRIPRSKLFACTISKEEAFVLHEIAVMDRGQAILIVGQRPQNQFVPRGTQLITRGQKDQFVKRGRFDDSGIGTNDLDRLG
jgi:hypothetical protein